MARFKRVRRVARRVYGAAKRSYKRSGGFTTGLPGFMLTLGSALAYAKFRPQIVAANPAAGKLNGWGHTATVAVIAGAGAWKGPGMLKPISKGILIAEGVNVIGGMSNAGASSSSYGGIVLN